MSKDISEMGVANIVGFQVPIGIKKRKKKVDEMLELNKDLQIFEVLSYLSALTENNCAIVENLLDENQYVKLASMIRESCFESVARAYIRNKIREVVRKNDSGGYSLYAPNPDKGSVPKKAADFPTKAAAKRAELHRYPPKDPGKLIRLKKEVDKLKKNPELAVIDKDKSFHPKKKTASASKVTKIDKKEAIERLVKSITESLFREDKKGSEWDDYVAKLSKQAVLADKSFQSYQKAIVKRSEKTLHDSFLSIKAALTSNEFEAKDKGTKKDEERGINFLEFMVVDKQGTAEVGPFHIVIENGYPKIDVSSEAKNGMVRLDPERNKLLRSELMTVQEDVLDSDDSVLSAIQKRDEYLMKSERKLDDFVANLNALEITMLKRILVSKYRKIS